MMNRILFAGILALAAIFVPNANAQVLDKARVYLESGKTIDLEQGSIGFGSDDGPQTVVRVDVPPHMGVVCYGGKDFLSAKEVLAAFSFQNAGLKTKVPGVIKMTLHQQDLPRVGVVQKIINNSEWVGKWTLPDGRKVNDDRIAFKNGQVINDGKTFKLGSLGHRGKDGASPVGAGIANDGAGHEIVFEWITPTVMRADLWDLGKKEGEIVELLNAKGAKTGDVMISLAWSNKNDIDLHVIEPSGEKVWYNHRTTKTGGHLDLDANVQYEKATTNPVEHIYWPAGKAPKGRYKIIVDHYKNHGQADCKDPTKFTVRLAVGGVTRLFHGEVVRNDPKRKQMVVAEFEVPLPNQLVVRDTKTKSPVHWRNSAAKALGVFTLVDNKSEESKIVDLLNTKGAKGGAVQVSLAWSNPNDLDLHVIDPTGQKVWWSNRSSKTGGKLDIDANVNYSANNTTPVENIFWPEGKAPKGRYKIIVDHYKNHGQSGCQDPTPFTVRLAVGGVTRLFRGEVANNDPKRKQVVVAEFDVGGSGSGNVAGGPRVINGNMDAKEQKHAQRMDVGTEYTINMQSKNFDTLIRLLGPDGKQVAFDDDGGDGLNSRLVFSPTVSGNYTVVATSYRGEGRGAYTLAISSNK